MLDRVLAVQYTHLTLLADAWLAAGASGFGIWRNERPVATWPNDRALAAEYISSQLRMGSSIVGELRVAGLDTQAMQLRLDADAVLLSTMIEAEDDLQSLTAELSSTQDQLLAVYQLMQSLRRQVTLEETLQSLAREAARLLKARNGFVVFMAGDTQPLVAQEGEPALDDALIWRLFWETHASEREVLLAHGRGTDPVPSHVQDIYFTPIRIRDVIVAGLGLASRSGSAFTASDVRLARALADQAGAQIENVNLYQEQIAQARLQAEVELARRVQLSLMPQDTPIIEGIEIAGRSRPASQVGGDFYDYINPPGRPFIFTVGDITGKGLPAALLMTMTRTALHSKSAFQPDPSPEAIMRQANEDLYDDFTAMGKFATVFLGQYQASEHRLVYANAGHSPVIYRPCGGNAYLLRAEETALGVLEHMRPQNLYVKLDPGDLIVVATDGMTDVRNDTDMFGYDRLIGMVDALADRPAREIVDSLFEAVERFAAGHPQDDDQTLVVIKGVA